LCSSLLHNLLPELGPAPILPLLDSLCGDSPIKLDAKRSNAPPVVSIIIATRDTRALPIWNLKTNSKQLGKLLPGVIQTQPSRQRQRIA
jgi:hypothetical protein